MTTRSFSDRDHLREFLHDQWRVQIQHVMLGTMEFEIWTADVEDALKRFEQDPARGEPYWAQTWNSGLDCANELIQNPDPAAEVLDLGCGVGVVGAAAASTGAKVWLGDSALDALPFAELNTWDWRRNVVVQRIDWTVDRLNRDFSLIVGADILYDQTQWETLSEFWQVHLRSGGRVLLGEPNRQSASGFDDFCRCRNWTVESQNSAHGRMIWLQRETD